MKFEYIRIRLDFGDLTEPNRFGSVGWKVVAVTKDDAHDTSEAHWALLERAVSRD